MVRPLFVCFVALVALAPVPFGAAPRLAEAALAAALGVLALAFALTAQRAPDGRGPRAARTWWLAAGFALFLAWGFAQVLPIWPAALADPAWLAVPAGDPAARTAAGGLPLSADPAAGLTALMRLVAYATVFWLALHAGRDSGRARVLLWSLVAAGSANAVYGMVMLYGDVGLVLWWDKRFYSEAVTGTFVNRNHFATYAAMLGVAALLLLMVRVSAIGGRGLGFLPRLGFVLDNLGRGGWAALAASLMLLSAVALSTSRAGMLAALAGIAVAFLAVAGRPGARRWTWGAAFAGALVCGGLAAFAFGLLDGLLGRLGTQETGALADRWQVAEITLAALAERPLTGLGLGSFPGLFEAGRTAALAGDGRSFLYAHNSYLELAAEVGWPAFLLLQALLLGVAWRCWRGLRERRQDWVYCAVALAAGSVAALHAAFDFSLQIPGVGVTLAALLGLGFAQSWRQAAASNGRAWGSLTDR